MAHGATEQRHEHARPRIYTRLLDLAEHLPPLVELAAALARLDRRACKVPQLELRRSPTVRGGLARRLPPTLVSRAAGEGGGGEGGGDGCGGQGGGGEGGGGDGGGDGGVGEGG